MPEQNKNVDPRIATATSHWAHRFTANGVPLYDFQSVAAEITQWDEWCAAWSKRGAVHEALGKEALDAGFALSAAEHYTRGGVCYHFGKFLFVHKPDELKAAHAKAVACRNAALPHLRPAGERVAIPFDGKHLHANFRKPDGIDKPPVVVMCMGLDSSKEEMDSYETDLLRRGMATLCFDGPGQGEGEFVWAMRPDYEAPVHAVFDWLEKRDDVDRTRIGLWGVSLGGYFAPRAAAFEHRAKACVGLSGPYRWIDVFDKANELTREAFRVRTHSADAAAARDMAAKFTLEGVAKNIRCPLLIMAGTRDTLIPDEHGRRAVAEAGPKATLLMVEEGSHVSNNVWYRYRPQVADFMAHHLGARG